MLILSNTDTMTLVTSAACAVDVTVHYVDSDASQTPGRQAAAITTATTTTIASAIGGSMFRNIKQITIRNKHATDAVAVTLNHVGDSTVQLKTKILNSGASLEYEDSAGWSDAEQSVEFSMAPGRRYCGWSAGLGTGISAISNFGMFTATLGGTGSSIGAASATDGTAVATGTARKRITGTSTANRSAELYLGSTFVGAYVSGLVGFGGFFAEMRFISGISNPTNKRGFFGFIDNGSALAESASPSGQTNCFGFAFDAAETTFRWQHNDGSGSATRIDLGADFPTRTATDLNTARIWCLPGVRAVHWWIKNETTQKVAQGITTTDLPANGTGLAWHMHQNNGGTAAATEWDFAYLKLLLP